MSRLVSSLLLLIFLAPVVFSQGAPAATELSENSVQALLIRKVAPVYPPLARQARIQGTVILKIVINKDGDVRDVQLYSGHPMLAPAAIEGVKQWKYQPYTKDGEVVEVSTMVRVNFKMPDEIGAAAGTVGDAPGDSSYVPPTAAGYERVSEAKMRRLRIQKIDPVYPPLAIQARLQAIVVLDLMISASGKVEKVRLISGHPILAPSAGEAAKQWKYMPYVKDGSAVAVATRVRLSYALSESGAGVVSEPPAEEMKVVRDDPGMATVHAGGVASGLPNIAVPQLVRVSSGVSQGLLISKVALDYPEDAREQDIQGTVILHVIVDKEGNVSDVELISGHPMLSPAAIEAVRQWKYRPYLLNGEAVDVDTQVQVNFVLAK